MSSSLDDLFEQIISTEQRAQQRRNVINEVKAAYMQCEEKIQDVEEETKVIQGQIALRLQQWSREEVNVKCLKAERDIKQAIKQQMEEKRNELTHQLRSLEDSLKSSQLDFCDKVEKFASEYDLISHSTQRHREQSKQETIKAQEVIDSLEKELKDFEVEIAKLTERKTTKRNLEKELADRRKSMNEEHNQELKRLEEEKQRLNQLPHLDPQFKRLQHELEVCRGETIEMETLCSVMQQELAQLQQRQWQQQMKKKR